MERETVPSEHNWQQEFFVVDGSVSIRNNITMADIERYKGKDEGLQEIDDLFPISEDMVLNFGKKQGEINMVLLVPKTESRSNQEEVTINKVMANRLKEPFLINTLSSHFHSKRHANNMKRLRIRYEIYSYETDALLISGESEKISDSANKDHGVLDFTHAVPPSSCERGGRKVFMRSLGQIAAEVEPRFQLMDSHGQRLRDMEHLLIQPNDTRFPDAKNVMTLKEMMIFITPAQPEGVVEKIVINKWKIKVVGFRPSDQFESRTAFPFQYVPHDFYEPCIHCSMDTDGYSGPVTLPTPIQPARPGVRKRNMTCSKLLSAKKPKSKSEDDRECLMNQIPETPEVELLSVSPSPSQSPSNCLPSPPVSLLQSYLLDRLSAPSSGDPPVSMSPSVTKTDHKCLISRPPLTTHNAPRSLLTTHDAPSHSLPVVPVPSLYTSSQTSDPGKVSVIKSILTSRKVGSQAQPQQTNKKLIALLTSPLSSQKVLSKDPSEKAAQDSSSYTSPQEKLHSLSLSPSVMSRPLPELIPINGLGPPPTDIEDQ